MTEFAGFRLPLFYENQGIVEEHNWCRGHAALFDVSHLRQVWIQGRAQEEVATFLERLVPGDILALPPGRQCYTQLLDVKGGIIDDVIIGKPKEEGYQHRLYMVANAWQEDCPVYVQGSLPLSMSLVPADNVLVALQGPEAASVLRAVIREKVVTGLKEEEILSMKFMDFRVPGEQVVTIVRGGYTGEDGFELSLEESVAEAVVEAFVEKGAKLAGLGARNTLRLEAGLCLYGADLTRSRTPVEAGLWWSVGKTRRSSLTCAGGEHLQKQRREGVQQKLVGLRMPCPPPAREGACIFSEDDQKIGIVTSGALSPTLGIPVALAYVRAQTKLKQHVLVEVRHKKYPATIVSLPFVPHRYVMGKTVREGGL